MCTNPILIKNPNYQQSSEYLRRTTDTTSVYIRVPCGNCASCRFIQQTSLYQRLLLESDNCYIYFCTLTYNEQMVKHYQINDMCMTYAPYKDFQNFMKRLRKHDLFHQRKFRFLCCREYGKKRSRVHWHVLFFLSRLESDEIHLTPVVLETKLKKLVLSEWRRNEGSTRAPVYKDLCTYVERFKNGKWLRNYDLHLVRFQNGSIDDVLFYVLKYMSKESKFFKKVKYELDVKYDHLHSGDYYKELNELRPKIWKSVNFGNSPDVERLIKSMIKRSREENSPFPYFIYKNHRFPLARYYKTKYMTQDDVFYFADAVTRRNGKVVYDDYDPVLLARQASEIDKRLEKVDLSDVFDIFDDD